MINVIGIGDDSEGKKVQLNVWLLTTVVALRKKLSLSLSVLVFHMDLYRGQSLNTSLALTHQQT